MQNSKFLVRKGKEMSFLLRHDKEAFNKGLIDENGWRSVSELCMMMCVGKEFIEEIVDTNDKKRYEFNEDKTYVRARQGHSIPVDVELKETVPPNILYHGTSEKAFYGPISETGCLKPMSRLYVHLSGDEETATKVGQRHGVPYIIKIDAKKMYEDGCVFYLSNNGVWLTKIVDSRYFIRG